MADEKKPAQVEPDKIIKSKINAFPPEIIRGIDEAIAKGMKADRVRAYIVRTYKGALEIPNRKTVDLYMKRRYKAAHQNADKSAELKKKLDLTEEELREMHGRLNVAGTDITNLKGILQKMVSLMLSRIQLMSQLQDNLLDPRVEHNIIKQVGEVRVLTVKLMETEVELGVHEAVARLIIDKFLFELAPVVRRAAEDTYGSSKSKEFIERLQKGYKSIDFQRIRNEAVVEVSQIGKEKTDVKKIGSYAA